MSSSGAYASGKYAIGICQRCGFKAPLNELVFDGYYTNLRVHVECRDFRHPQERIVTVRDPQTLWRPSPEQADVPPVLEGELTEDNDIQLNWSAADPNFARIERYEVYRAVVVDPDEEQSFFLIEVLPVVYSAVFLPTITTLDFLDDTVAQEVVYQYYVSAFDCYDHELRSNVIELETQEDPAEPADPVIFDLLAANTISDISGTGYIDASINGSTAGSVTPTSFAGYDILGLLSSSIGGTRILFILKNPLGVTAPPQNVFTSISFIDKDLIFRTFMSAAMTYQDGGDGSAAWNSGSGGRFFTAGNHYSITVA